MQCPLTEYEVVDAVNQLPVEFDTPDFIAKCPRSGGTEQAPECKFTRSGADRIICGKCLADHASKYPSHLRKTGPGGRAATWKRKPGMPSSSEELRRETFGDSPLRKPNIP